MALNLQPYESGVLAQGSINGRQATSADFGGEIAQGLDSVSRGIGAVAITGNQIDQDQARLWASTAVSQKELALKQASQDHLNSLDPTAPGYPEQIKNLTEASNERTQQATADLMEQAPDGAARKQVSYHMANAGLRLTDIAMQQTSKLNADYTTGLVQQGMKADTDIIAASPDNDTVARKLQMQHDTIVGLSTIDPETKHKLLQNVVHTYSATQAYSVMSADPRAFLASLNLNGGVTSKGVQHGGVPTTAPGDGSAPAANTTAPAQPEMLAFANAQLADGKSQVDAMRATAAKYPDRADKFAFAAASDGKSFTDLGKPAGDPQVQMMAESDIASSNPPMMGWKNLEFPEKVQLVRQAEGLVGKAMAANRGQGRVAFQDAMASFAAGQDYPGLSALKEQNTALLDPADSQRRNDALDFAQQVGGFIGKVKDMPTAQAQQLVSQYKPQGGDEFAVKQPMYERALAALNNVQTQQQKAPIDYAIQNNIAGAAVLDFKDPQKLGEGLRQRVAVNAAMTRDYGTKASIFTDDEVNLLQQGIAKMPAHEAVAYLASIHSSLGNTKDYATAMDQLGGKNPMLAYAGNLATTNAVVSVSGQPMAATDIAAKILDGDRINNGRTLVTGKGSDPSMPAGANANHFNENQFRAAFDLALPPQAFQSPDATRSAGQQKDMYNAVKDYYTADAFEQGKSTAQINANDVVRAVQAVTGGTTPMGNGGTLMVPFGVKVEDFQSQWHGRAMQALQAAGHSEEDSNRSMNKLRPINLDNGRYGFMSGTYLLVDPKTSAPVTVNYADAYAPPALVQSTPMFGAQTLGTQH
jgi:hypothetical protein